MLPHRTICANLDALGAGRRVRLRLRGARVVAAALPRHGSRRLRHAADDHGRRPGARRAAGLPGRARCDGWSGCRTSAAPRPPVRTSRGCSPPGRSRNHEPLDLSRAAHRAQRRRAGRSRHASSGSSRPPSRTVCGRAPCSRRSAWPRSSSPAPSRRRWPACAPTPSTCASSRRSPTRRRRRSVLRALAAWRGSGDRSPDSRSASSIRRRGPPQRS